MRGVLVLAIASACSGGGGDDGGWTFTASVNVGHGDEDVDLAAGASVMVGSDSMFLSGEDVGASCTHTIRFDIPTPVAVQTYELAWFGGPLAQYTDCQSGGFVYTTDSMYGGELAVTRVDSSCRQPPCIDATFAFNLAEPISPTTTLTYTVRNGHVSNY